MITEERFEVGCNGKGKLIADGAAIENKKDLRLGCNSGTGELELQNSTINIKESLEVGRSGLAMVKLSESTLSAASIEIASKVALEITLPAESSSSVTPFVSSDVARIGGLLYIKLAGKIPSGTTQEWTLVRAKRIRGEFKRVTFPQDYSWRIEYLPDQIKVIAEN